MQEVKSRLNIEDVIGEYVQLKRSGRNFKGLSPWTNEKTASFIVSPEKQIWHDFSSGKGGDVFSFVMELEGLDFKATLELLGRKAGVDLEQFSGTQNKVRTDLKNRVLEALELATKFYQRQLTANKPALNYLLKDRKFSKQTLLNWRLGYAPNKGTALSDFLTKRGFEATDMKRAGLIVERRGGIFDMFRGRIIFPLADSRGMVVGFTARQLEDEPNSPKYINTPQTIVYDKSRQVFGLHFAKEMIRKKDFVVCVEGQTDVIASHQAGVTNVVASAGTAMTEGHLRQLKRFTGDVRLCFDADRAGVNATERIIPLAQKTDLDLSIVTIKEGLDPDQLIQKDIKQWKEAIEKANYAPDWLIDRYKSQLDLNTAQGKKAFTDTLLATIRRLRDPVEQEHYIKKVAKLTDTSFESIKAKLSLQTASGATVASRRYKIEPQKIDRAELEYQTLQDHFLAMMLMQPSLRDLLEGCKSSFFREGSPKNLFRFLKKHPYFKDEPKLAKELQPDGDYVKILMLQFEEVYQALPSYDLEEQAVALKYRLLDRYAKIQKHQLAILMASADSDVKLRQLMQEADKLNQLIK